MKQNLSKMKVINAVLLSACVAVTFAGVSTSRGASAGGRSRLSKLRGETPTPVPVQAPAYVAAPVDASYTAPAPAPYVAPETPTDATYAAPNPTYVAPENPTDATYTAPGPAHVTPAAPTKVCWTETKSCCYEEKSDGYECKDYYAYKYARCHPKVTYKSKCDDAVSEPAEHPAPADYTQYSESVVKNYDNNYGPHVEGYPNGGVSETYDSKGIPEKPYGVTADPVAPYKPTPPTDAYAAPPAEVAPNDGGAYTAPTTAPGDAPAAAATY